jgi:uncharacterized membrane protein
MAHWLVRLFRHRLVDERDAHRALDDEAMKAIERRIAASEARHSGEIRVCVEAGLPFNYLRRNASARDRAVALFGKLRVWDTESNNGVLIYLLLAEHAIEIVADRGLLPHADAATWEKIMATMQSAFHEGRFADGLAQAIDAVDALLVQHFPLGEGAVNPNELPDAPMRR